MASQNENWTRLYAVIQWAGMTTNYFAHHIGLPCGENLYQIKRGNNGISKDVANRIVERFPDINKAWLLTGIGNMFADNTSLASSFSYYNQNIEEVKSISGLAKDDYKMFVPQLSSCDLAISYHGPAMGKRYPANTTLFLKKISTNDVISGNIYAIVTEDYCIVRKAFWCEDDSTLRLESDNRDLYEDISLETEKIKEIYLVIGHLIVNA